MCLLSKLLVRSDESKRLGLRSRRRISRGHIFSFANQFNGEIKFGKAEKRLSLTLLLKR